MLYRLSQKLKKAAHIEIALHSEQGQLEDSEIERLREETVAEMVEEVFWMMSIRHSKIRFFARFMMTRNGARSFKPSAAQLKNLLSFWNCDL